MEMGHFFKFSLFLIISVLCIDISSAYRTCGEADMCCKGTNNTCFALGPTTTDHTSGAPLPERPRCFCDEFCGKNGDCCTDYSRFCARLDCVLGEWTMWTDCRDACGKKPATRKRAVVQAPQNGGQECEHQKEKRPCPLVEGKCLQFQDLEIDYTILRESAKIMPVMFSKYRKSKEYSFYKDIRKNLLYARHYEENIIKKRPTYCARFNVTESRRECKNAIDYWANSLEEGQEVCVQCEPEAMMKHHLRCRGEGILRQETAWRAFKVHHCFGKWVQIEAPQSCTCTTGDMSKNFIFI